MVPTRGAGLRVESGIAGSLPTLTIKKREKSPNMYLVPTERHWACDIEADNLLDKATTIWCAVLVNCVTKQRVECLTKEEFHEFQKEHPTALFVGHNFLSYDAPMLNRHWKAGIGVGRIVDTFVLSQLYAPNLEGGHSLAAWGRRLRHPKTEHADFSAYSPEMLTYCNNDTSLTALLFVRLSERMRSVGFSEEGCSIEHHAWHIIQNKQRRNGFPFDYRRAHELYVTLRAREEELKNDIYKLWPPRLEHVATYKSGRKRDGSLRTQYVRHQEQYPKLEWTGVGEEYAAFDFVAFNLGSPSQRIAKLLELGWQPINLTPKGNPKVDEDELLSFAESSGQEEIGKLAKWIVINSLANMVNTWLEAYNEKTGAIHGSLFLASTLRYRHSSPNSANIPAVRQKKDDNGNEYIAYGEDGAYTYEVRDLWMCGDPQAWSLVGIDGTGIQNRCLIHSLIKTVGEERVADFKALSLEGDIHKRNIEILGLANKAAAKKFYYTLMMGGAGKRLAADQAQFGTKMTAQEGNKKKALLIESMPGFGALIEALEKELAETGRIRLCDGTPILVPSPHMVIPYLLQGDESRLMKKAMIFVDQAVRAKGLAEHVYKVADIHDEWQYRVRNEYVQTFIDLALPCFPRAGEHFNYNIRIDGDAKVGKTWAQTH